MRGLERATPLSGARCEICKKGRLVLEEKRPSKRQAAYVKEIFRCTECQMQHTQTVQAVFALGTGSLKI